ncbi:MAG: pyruvate dehydrogenase (acetyl-transferring) E1 component subunit alpha [Bdellovibrionota bacterium]
MIEKEQSHHHLLKQMLRIRMFEEACAEQYSAGNIRGFLHLYIGEEAVAVGAMELFSLEDAVFATYREHGHALMRGISARSIMAEMFGKASGCCGGRGGSMHLFDKETLFLGGSAIVGGALPIATGLALANKLQNRNRLSVCFFGEGAMAEGEFHEAMNLAALWKLPVLFICENNLYAMGTALERSESETNLVRKVESYRVRCASVDGMDVLAVREAVKRAIRDVKELGTPYFLECKTYRFRAHSMFDPELYRDKSEVEEWKKRDPIDLLSNILRSQNLLDNTEIATMRSVVKEEIDDAIAFAEREPLEDVDNLYRFVYAEESLDG